MTCCWLAKVSTSQGLQQCYAVANFAKALVQRTELIRNRFEYDQEFQLL
jgi:hypothetical protein